MPIGIIAPLIRETLRQGARYIYSGLRTQDKIIDFTYKKTGLYNRGIVRGIKHGLIAGQVVGGIAQLGLNASESPGNNDGILPQKRVQKRSTSRNAHKARSRCPRRPNRRYSSRYQYNYSGGKS